MELKDIKNIRFQVFKYYLEKLYKKYKYGNYIWYDLRDTIGLKLREMTFSSIIELLENKVIEDDMSINCIKIGMDDVQPYIRLLVETGILKPTDKNDKKVTKKVYITETILENFNLDDLNHCNRHSISMKQHLRLSKLKKLIEE